MNARPRRPRISPLTLAVLQSPRLSEALTTTAIGIAACALVIRRVIGVPGLLGAIAALLVVMAVSFLARRDELELRGLLPLSLLAFLGWTIVSLAWSTYPLDTLGALVYLLAYTLMGLYIALLRDTIQILRSVAHVVRFVLVVSLALEVISGIILDGPIRLLGITGGIATLGPITGVVGTRNLLGMIATIGAVTFVLEWRTRTTTRTTSLLSVVLAVVTILLTRSPVTFAVAGLVVAAFVILYALRRVRPERRTRAQIVALGVAAIGLTVTWAFRGPLVAAINAGGEADYRLRLWQQVVAFREFRELLGWGWIGRWDRSEFPYSLITSPTDRTPFSASNSYLDVWLQVGIVGLILFVVTIGLAFVRSWLLAGHRRSVVYSWQAMVLVTILFTALGESLLIIELGWLLLVICTVKASQELSWRRALDRTAAPSPTPQRG